MKKRQGEPWMPAHDYAKVFTGVVFNLIVSDMAAAIKFQRNVLSAEIIYSDEDFAAMEGYGSQWMLHADHTYLDHPMTGIIRGTDSRGAGIELRVMACDPDRSCAAAREHGYTILEDATDKAHGTREAFIIDPDGYLWVPTICI